MASCKNSRVFAHSELPGRNQAARRRADAGGGRLFVMVGRRWGQGRGARWPRRAEIRGSQGPRAASVSSFFFVFAFFSLCR